MESVHAHLGVQGERLVSKTAAKSSLFVAGLKIQRLGAQGGGVLGLIELDHACCQVVETVDALLESTMTRNRQVRNV